MKAELGAVDVAGASVSGSVLPDEHHAPVLTVAGYRATERITGSRAGFTAAQLLTLEEPLRELVDEKLVSWEKIAPTPVHQLPSSASMTFSVESQSAGTTSSVRSEPCVVFHAAPQGGTLALKIVSGRAVAIWAVDDPVELRLRRFAASYPISSLASADPGVPLALRLPPDNSTIPWHLQLDTVATAQVCSL